MAFGNHRFLQTEKTQQTVKCAKHSFAREFFPHKVLMPGDNSSNKEQRIHSANRKMHVQTKSKTMLDM